MIQLLYFWGKSSWYHWIGGCVGPRTSVEDVERRKILPVLGLKLPPFGHPAHRQSPYQLRYPLGLNSLTSYVEDCEKTFPELNHCNCTRTQFPGQCNGEGIPRKLATVTQRQFPGKIADFKQRTGFQISRGTLRKLMFE
jgi:hypothetical protein